MDFKQIKYLTEKELADAPDIIKLVYKDSPNRKLFKEKIYKEALRNYPEYFEK